ncbi:MAG TPA: hypothetical protein VL400_24060, partial [Polyangiaceae bacterium]|nr:hypothetical protein [Polyangiaceae bacterium]
SDEERTRMSVTDTLFSAECIVGSGRTTPAAPVALSAILAERGTATRGSVHYLHDTRDLEGPLAFGADDAALRMRLTSRNAKFGELYDVLDQPAFTAARKLASERFGELCPGFGIEGVRRFGTSFAPMITDASRGEARTADRVSTSERQAFLAALYTSRTPIVDSILMVDAPELGFGDRGAVDLVRALLRWTSRTQLIVATASDAVRDLPETAHVVELTK